MYSVLRTTDRQEIWREEVLQDFEIDVLCRTLRLTVELVSTFGDCRRLVAPMFLDLQWCLSLYADIWLAKREYTYPHLTIQLQSNSPFNWNKWLSFISAMCQLSDQNTLNLLWFIEFYIEQNRVLAFHPYIPNSILLFYSTLTYYAKILTLTLIPWLIRLCLGTHTGIIFKS